MADSSHKIVAFEGIEQMPYKDKATGLCEPPSTTHVRKTRPRVRTACNNCK